MSEASSGVQMTDNETPRLQGLAFSKHVCPPKALYCLQATECRRVTECLAATNKSTDPLLYAEVLYTI